MLQVPAGDVDRDAQALAGDDRVAPGLDGAAGFGEHPAAELDDLAGFLGRGDERARHYQAVVRVVPAHQRLDAEQFALGEVDDRLVLEEELAALERQVDVLLEAQPLAQLLLHARLEHHEARLAGRLRVVHRDVGVAQQLLGVVARLREGDADAGRDVGVAAVELQRLVEGTRDRRGDALDVGSTR